MRSAHRSSFAPSPSPSTVSWNLYVGSGSDVFGYRVDSNGQTRRVCAKEIARGTNLAVDGHGNLMVPWNDSGSYTDGVTIYQGPQMCGRRIGQVSAWPPDFGIAVDAASLDALTGDIVIALCSSVLVTWWRPGLSTHWDLFRDLLPRSADQRSSIRGH